MPTDKPSTMAVGPQHGPCSHSQIDMLPENYTKAIQNFEIILRETSKKYGRRLVVQHFFLSPVWLEQWTQVVTFPYTTLH